MEEVSIFTTKVGRDDRDGAVAVDEAELSERNRQGLEWLERHMGTDYKIDEEKWDAFERFLAENRLDLTRRTD